MRISMDSLIIMDTINVVLFIFDDSLFVVSQLETFDMLLLESGTNDDNELKRVVSSAYVMNLNSLQNLCM